MNTGTVKWYNETKGYGFIQPDSGGKDVFVHATALERAGMRGLREGQKITYELQTDQRTGKTGAAGSRADPFGLESRSAPERHFVYLTGGRGLQQETTWVEATEGHTKGHTWRRKN